MQVVDDLIARRIMYISYYIVYQTFENIVYFHEFFWLLVLHLLTKGFDIKYISQ
jgi:hypothetical protein